MRRHAFWFLAAFIVAALVIAPIVVGVTASAQPVTEYIPCSQPVGPPPFAAWDYTPTPTTIPGSCYVQVSGTTTTTLPRPKLCSRPHWAAEHKKKCG